ncbi:hypothetical protein AAVH_41542 [Aphelenchoides avenae]|nr:hypothetical protein AAVH_41542 [Aphelenchus avenae]
MDTIDDQLAKNSKSGTKLANFLQGRSDDISDALSTLVQRPTVHEYCQTDGTRALHVEVQATVTTLNFRGRAANS